MRKVNSRQRVLVIGPGRGVRGGITSVILCHASSNWWTQWDCRWLETYDDRSAIHKIVRACIALLLAPSAITSADIVHIHLAAAKSAARKLPFAVLAALLRKPLVLHFHASNAEILFKPRWKWVLDSLVDRAEVIVALSPIWKDEFAKRWPKKRIEVIPNPVPEPSHANCSKCPGTILYVGKLEPRKGYDVLLRAFVSVVAACPSAKLWFAGHGELTQASALARELKIEKHVEFFGWLRGSAKDQKLLSAEIFCLPTYAEGVPMSVLEAMAFGLPVVTTAVGGIPDIIRDGENGMLTSAGEPRALALHLIDLLKSPDLRANLGEKAKQSVTSSHGISHIGNLLTNIYESLLPPHIVRLRSETRPSSHRKPTCV